MIKMIAVDMDGTFLNSKKKYDTILFKKLYKKMKDKNIRFVVASGNQYYQLISFFPEIKNEISFVSENGALVIDQGEELFCGKIDQSIVKKTIELLNSDSQIQTIMCGRKSAYIVNGETEKFNEHASFYFHKLKTVEKFTDVESDNIFKFSIAVPPELTASYLKKLNQSLNGSLLAISSGHGDIDLIVPNLNKAQGLSILQQKYNISPSETVAFGDGGNDLEMLKASGYSYAMSNATPDVFKAAKQVIASNDDNGVLMTIEKLLS